MKLTRISLPARDPRGVAGFYGDTLGLPVDGDGVTVTVGLTRVHFVADPDLRTSHHLAFNVPAVLFDDARRWVAERAPLVRDESGADEFECSPRVNARSVYFEGPESSVLELIGRRERPDPAVGPFGVEHLRCVSEVGVAVDGGVAAAVDRLHATSGLTAYANPPSDTFGLVGTIDGLLVLVAPGRTWFPTEDRTVGRVRTEIEAVGATPGRYALSDEAHLTVRPSG